MSAWDAMTLHSDQRVFANTVKTYDVDSTFEGFKLILFRVRASGTGMLLPSLRPVGPEGMKLD
jgi:hypothetical protein